MVNASLPELFPEIDMSAAGELGLGIHPGQPITQA